MKDEDKQWLYYIDDALEEILGRRHSCRRFTDELMEATEIERIIEAAGRAPYASGGPRRRISVNTQTGRLQRLKEACYGQEYVAQCGVALVFFGLDAGVQLKSGFSKFVYDCTAACMCADLMATALGYGTCWIGHFDAEKVKKIYGTEDRPTIILLVGHEKT